MCFCKSHTLLNTVYICMHTLNYPLHSYVLYVCTYTNIQYMNILVLYCTYVRTYICMYRLVQEVIHFTSVCLHTVHVGTYVRTYVRTVCEDLKCMLTSVVETPAVLHRYIHVYTYVPTYSVKGLEVHAHFCYRNPRSSLTYM